MSKITQNISKSSTVLQSFLSLKFLTAFQTSGLFPGKVPGLNQLGYFNVHEPIIKFWVVLYLNSILFALQI